MERDFLNVFANLGFFFKYSYYMIVKQIVLGDVVEGFAEESLTRKPLKMILSLELSLGLSFHLIAY